MAEASPVDAALFAFRKRGKPFALTGASVVYVIASMALSTSWSTGSTTSTAISTRPSNDAAARSGASSTS